MATNTPLNFRIATANDAPQIAKLIQISFRAEDNGIAWTGPEVELNRTFTITPEEVLSTINNPEAEFLIATTDNSTLVGVMAAIKRSNELARLAMLAVDPSYQRTGLGRRVLANAEEYAQTNWVIKKTGLNALNNRGLLIEWYERQGYVRTGEKTPFPVKAFRDIELPEGLHFVEMEKSLDG